MFLCWKNRGLQRCDMFYKHIYLLTYLIQRTEMNPDATKPLGQQISSKPGITLTEDRLLCQICHLWIKWCWNQ